MLTDTNKTDSKIAADTADDSTPLTTSGGDISVWVAALIGALVAEVITLAIIFIVKRRKTSSKKRKKQEKAEQERNALSLFRNTHHNAESYNGQSKSESSNFNQSGNQSGQRCSKQDSYFTVGDATSYPPFSESTELVDEVKTRIWQPSYSPLTSSSDQDKELLVKNGSKSKNPEGTDRVFFKSDSPRKLPEGVDPQLVGNTTTNDSPVLQNDELSPPNLPPKQSNLKKSSAPRAFDDSDGLSSDSNVNNNNSKLPERPSALSSLLFPPPPPYPDKEEEDKSENHSLLSTPRSLTPPFRPPTPPQSKMRIRKHETFSGPHDQKIKPPVPPKSAAVIRSASLKSPIRSRSPGLGDSLFRNNLERLKSQGKPGNLTSLEKKSVANLPLNRLGRTSSLKHNPAPTNEARHLVDVVPPTVPVD